MESSRIQFEVLGLEGQDLGLGLEACKSLKMPCSRLEDSTIFWLVENGPRSWPILFRLRERQRACEKNFEGSFFFEKLDYLELRPFFFGDHFRVVSLVLSLGLECSYPWPRERVLGKTVLDLGFFLCAWPCPRVLCPRLHLWFKRSNKYVVRHF